MVCVYGMWDVCGIKVYAVCVLHLLCGGQVGDMCDVEDVCGMCRWTTWCVSGACVYVV